MHASNVQSRSRPRGTHLLAALTLAGWIAVAPARVIPSPLQPPAAASPELKRLLGEYGSAESPLTIYEADGQLIADGSGLHRQVLRELSSTRFATASSELRFDVERNDRAVSVTIREIQLPFIDIGLQAIDTIRSGAHTNAVALRADAMRASPPIESPPRRAAELVDLASIDSSIKFDIRYATSNNFMGFPLYERGGAYLQRPAARALRRTARRLRKSGYGLLVYDAYRPWFVTEMFWQATPPSAHIFVADPAQGSRHNRGCAVDLTLYSLDTGQVVEMTGGYDEMSPRSYADFKGGTTRQRFLRDLLRRAMEKEGFAVYPQEWWHFDYKDWPKYGIGNVPFDRLELQRLKAKLPVAMAPTFEARSARALPPT